MGESESNDKINHKKSINGILMRKIIILMVVLLLIFSVVIAGCTSDDTASSTMTTQPTTKIVTPKPTTISPTIQSIVVTSPTPQATIQSYASVTQKIENPTPIETTTSIISTTFPLKLGETTIMEYNGFKKSVRVVSFNQQIGVVVIESKNVGDSTITKGSKKWVIDGSGVEHISPDPWELTDNFYPSESRSNEFNVYELQDMTPKVKSGKITFYYSFGDQIASWVIKE
jgi:hypothetical protein